MHAIISVGGITAICLVHNGSIPRLGTSTNLAITRLTEMFPSDCLANFIVCLTNVSNSIQTNCIDTLNELEIPMKSLFRFDNSCLRPPSITEIAFEKLSGDDKNLFKNLRDNEENWQENQLSFDRLMKLVQQLDDLSTDSIRDLLIERESQGKVINFQTFNIHNLELQRETLKKQTNQIIECQRIIEDNKDTTNVAMRPKKIKKMVKKVIMVKEFNHEKAKLDDIKREGYCWGARIVTLGTVYLGEVLAGELGNKQKNYEEKYAIEVPREVEIEVEEWTIEEYKYEDSEKKKVLEDKIVDLKNLENDLKSTMQEFKVTLEEIEKSYKIIATLESNIEGKSIKMLNQNNTNERKLLQIEEDLKAIALGPYSPNIDGIKKNLENLKLVIQNCISITAEAKQYRMQQLSEKDKLYLEKVLMECEESESKHLIQQRERYEKSLPCEINCFIEDENMVRPNKYTEHLASREDRILII